ncbi:MAG TPA: NERD domain-containing protein [Methanocorpusculum sp.]|nr:NERD domain-containing protein [Methanocorpusculum sp.]
MHKKLLKSRWIFLTPAILFLLGAAVLILPAALAKSVSFLITPLFRITNTLPATYLAIGLLLIIPAAVIFILQNHSRKTSAAEILNSELLIIRNGKLKTTLHAEDIITVEISEGFFDSVTKTARITIRAKQGAGKQKSYHLGRVADAAEAGAVLDVFRGIRSAPRRKSASKKTVQTKLKESEAKETETPKKTRKTAAKKEPEKETGKEPEGKQAGKKRTAKKTAAKITEGETADKKTAEKKTAAKKSGKTVRAEKESAEKTSAKKTPKKTAEKTEPADDKTGGFDYPDIRTRKEDKLIIDKPLLASEEAAKAEYLRRTTGSEKGAEFEDEVDVLLKRRDTIPAHHRTLKNLYVPYGDGTKRLSEIDNVVISETGIYVFECKNYSGTILGKKDEREWSVVYDNGDLKKFYSPILQNKGHIRSLSDILGIPKDIFRSVIVFSGHTNLNGVEYSRENTSVFCVDTLADELRAKTASAEHVLSSEEVDEIYSWMTPYTEISYEDRIRHLNRVEKLSQKGEA